MTNRPASTSPKLDAALRYARLGLRVVPLHTPTSHGRCSCKKPECDSIGKHPRIKDWTRQATTDERVIKAWWGVWPDANVGIVTGAGSGIFALDVDPRHGGDQALRELEEKHGRLPDTPISGTGSGGNHVIFKHPGWKVPTKANIAPGLDVRGDGGQIVAPPSQNANGGYEWIDGLAMGEVAIADAPQWLLDLIQAQTPKARPTSTDSRRRDPAEILKGVPEGERDETVFHYASRLRGIGHDRAEAEVLVLHAAAKCTPPFPEATALEKVARAWANYPGPLTAADADDGDDSAAERDGIPVFPTCAWRGLFDDYRKLMHPGVSEASEVLHYANFLALIAAEMGRHFVIHSGDDVAANVYILNVARSALGRKSTAKRLVDRHIRRQLSHSAVTLRNGASTGEGILEELKGAPNLLLYYDEFSRLLTTQSRGGNTLEDILNEAFSLGPIDKLVASKSVCISEGYSLSVLANATPIGLQQKMTGQNMFGGLMSRFLFFASDDQRDVPYTFPPKDEESRWIVSELDGRLQAWRSLSSEPIRFTFDQKATARYGEWYKAMRVKLRALPDQRQASLADRVLLYAKKIAMVYGVLEFDPSVTPELSEAQIEVGIAVAEFGYESLLWTTRDWAGPRSGTQERQAEIEKKVKGALIANQGRLSVRKLLRTTSLHATELWPVLNAMKAAGLLDLKDAKTTAGQTTTVVIWLG